MVSDCLRGRGFPQILKIMNRFFFVVYNFVNARIIIMEGRPV